MDGKVALLVLVSCALVAGCASAPRAPLGAETFERHCAACHGGRGEGDGPVAAELVVPVPNLRTLSARNGGIFPADSVASYIDGRDLPAAHGARAMPVWGTVFDATARLVTDAEGAQSRIESLVTYLRELQLR